MTFSPDPQNTWQGPRVRMRNLSAFTVIGAIGAERRAKGGALFHIICQNSIILVSSNWQFSNLNIHKSQALKIIFEKILLRLIIRRDMHLCKARVWENAYTELKKRGKTY